MIRMSVLIDIKGMTAAEHEACKEIDGNPKPLRAHADYRPVERDRGLSRGHLDTQRRHGYVPTSLSLDILVAALGLVLAGGIFHPDGAHRSLRVFTATAVGTQVSTAPGLQMVPQRPLVYDAESSRS